MKWPAFFPVFFKGSGKLMKSPNRRWCIDTLELNSTWRLFRSETGKITCPFLFRSPFKKQITSPRATCPRTLQRLARRDSDVVDSCPFLWTQRTKGNTPWIDVIQQYTLSFLFEHGFQADGPNMSFHGFSWIFDMTFHNCIHLNPLDLIDGCFLSPGDRLLRHQLRPMPMPCALHGVQEASMTPDADGWALLVSLRWSCNHLEFRICMKL